MLTPKLYISLGIDALPLDTTVFVLDLFFTRGES
jgi:hypothetical protein